MRFTFLTILSIILTLRAIAISGGNSEAKLQVQKVEVQVVRSTPLQVFVRVHGVVLNGCTYPGTVEQHHEAGMVTVTIPTYTTAKVCTGIARLVDEKIRLSGTFPPGSYSVNVNGVVEHFQI
jgi:hypothetical protein